MIHEHHNWKTFTRAVETDDVEAMSQLLAEGLDPNAAMQPNSWPLLNIAIEHQAGGVTQLLLKAGAEIHKLGGKLTPLNHAIDVETDTAHQSGVDARPFISALLLANGADPSIKDAFGRDTIELATELKYQAFLDLL